MLNAAIEGMGLAQLPGPMARAALGDGRLVELLDRFAPTAPGVFLYYPDRRQVLPKLRALVDHIKNRQESDALGPDLPGHAR